MDMQVSYFSDVNHCTAPKLLTIRGLLHAKAYPVHRNTIYNSFPSCPDPDAQLQWDSNLANNRAFKL